MHRALVALTAVAAVVAGCAPPTPRPAEPALEVAAHGGDGGTPDGAASRDPVPQVPAISLAAARAHPDGVLGKGPDGVRALLGEPGRVRSEPPARIWQYRADGCVLDIFLYKKNGMREVAYLEARDGGAAPVAAAPCLTAVAQDHAAPANGAVFPGQ